MTAAEEKAQYVAKLAGLVGDEHEEQFKRLPAKALKAILDAFSAHAKAPAPTGSAYGSKAPTTVSG